MVNTILAVLGAGLLRNITGWATSSLEDGKVNEYEWKLLVATLLRTGVLTGVAYFGLKGLDIDNPMMAAAVGFFSDMIFERLKGIYKAFQQKK